MPSAYLGIEIGGTKLQLGVGAGDGSDFVAFERLDVDPARGADGILAQIEQTGRRLLARENISRIGIGFGGPVDAVAGRVVKSHQIAGWDDVPLVDWCKKTLQRPAILGNDCDCAALAEARFGAGRAESVVFFVTVGTGIGGGLVIDGQLHGSGRPAVAEIGHLRPGLSADRADLTVESFASGRGIEAAVNRLLASEGAHPLAERAQSAGRPVPELFRHVPMEEQDKLDLLSRCGGDPEQVTAKLVAEAAADGNGLALHALGQAIHVLGWAIAQVIGLVAPSVVVIGGGVSLIGQPLFFEPLRRQVGRYVFPPLADSYRIVPAELGEEVVVQGALARAASGTF